MKIKYIAEDGTEFENQQACLDYEKKQKLNIWYLCSAFSFYRHSKWAKVENLTDLEENLHSIESTHLQLERDLTEKEDDALYAEFGYIGPTEEGLYRYNENEMWIKFEDEFTEWCNNYPMYDFTYKLS